MTVWTVGNMDVGHPPHSGRLSVGLVRGQRPGVQRHRLRSRTLPPLVPILARQSHHSWQRSGPQDPRTSRNANSLSGHPPARGSSSEKGQGRIRRPARPARRPQAGAKKPRGEGRAGPLGAPASEQSPAAARPGPRLDTAAGVCCGAAQHPPFTRLPSTAPQSSPREGVPLPQ